jgi:hypothetical protein
MDFTRGDRVKIIPPAKPDGLGTVVGPDDEDINSIIVWLDGKGQYKYWPSEIAKIDGSETIH